MGRFSFTLTTVGAMVTATSASGQANARTLFDQLPSVGVHVVGVNPTIDSMGVDSTPVRLAIESRLQREGVATLDRAQLLSRQETPRLVAHLAGFRVDSAFFYTVTLELLEPVLLDRSGLRVYAYDWSQQVIGVAEPGQVRSAIAQAVDQLTGLFLDGRRRAQTVASQ